jgi:predicted ATPase/DNA-binding XRE family transcriptional regulator
MDAPVSFGQWLRQRRKSLDLTQIDLAERAGCSKSTLRKIESDERRPSQQLAALIATSLDISPDDEPTFVKVARGVLAVDRLGPASSHYAPSHLPSHQSHLTGYGLPTPPTPLIGRELELAELRQLLDDPACRLLTIVGLPGIGKTRLAVETASIQQPQFTDGVYFVSLASLGSPEFIIPALADVLGIAFSGPADPVIQLTSYLRSRNLLLLLDNMEHLLEGAGLLSDLLHHTPNIKLLITSRERLNLQGEWTFDLHGLPVPPADQAEGLDNYNSVALFLLRARRAHTGFEPNREDERAIAHICRLVGGLPLGIELAAAWVPILSCGEIAKEIESNLDFLTTSMRDVPERHRSMKAVFDHSWRLLSEEEQHALSRISVFRGGYNRTAAEDITKITLQLLASLVSKSLVRRAESGRYDLHEVVRQYGLSRLADDPQREVTIDRHSAFYLALVRDREAPLKSAAQRGAVRELTDEIDNIRAALSWAIKREKFGTLGPALQSFELLFGIKGWFREGTEQLELIVQALRTESDNEEEQKVLGQALAQQARLFQIKGDYDQAQIRYEQSLDVLRPIGDQVLLSHLLIFYGILLFLCGELDQAQSLNDEGLAYAQAAGDVWLTAHGLYDQGYIAGKRGRYVEAYEQMSAGLALWRALGDPSSTALGLNHLAPTAITLGRYEEAQSLLQESLDLCARVGDRWGLGTAYRHLGMSALAQGNISEAQSLIQKSLELFTEVEARADIAQSLTYLGEARAAAGDSSEARRAFLEALLIAVELPAVPTALDALLELAILYDQSGETETAFKLSAFVMEHSASTWETRDRAEKLRAKVTAKLSPQQIQAAQAWLSAQSLDTVTMAILTEGSESG